MILKHTSIHTMNVQLIFYNPLIDCLVLVPIKIKKINDIFVDYRSYQMIIQCRDLECGFYFNDDI